MSVLHSISACLICRFILNLRTVYFPGNVSQQTHVMSTIHFVSTPPGAQAQVASITDVNGVVGNIGAPLRTDEDDRLTEELYISDDPFSFGLVPDTEIEAI